MTILKDVTLKLVANLLESMDLKEETDDLQDEDRNLLTIDMNSETREEKFDDHLDRLDFENFNVIFVN